MKHTRLQRREDQKLSMTAMIDVTFLLLVFFLCTLRFKSLEGKLEVFLPDDAGQSTKVEVEREAVEIRVRVVAEGTRVQPGTGLPWSGLGNFDFNGREIGFSIAGRELTDSRALAVRLRGLHDADPTRRVKIQALAGVRVQEVTTAVDESLAAGFEDVSFTALSGR